MVDVYPVSLLRGAHTRLDVRQVYFIEAEGLGLVKIGVANCAKTRLATLAKQSPVPLRLVKVFPTDRIGSLEKDLHARFAEHRSHGEWFRTAPDVLAYMDTHTD